MHSSRFFIVLSLVMAAVFSAAGASPQDVGTAPPTSNLRVISLWGGARSSVVLLSDGTVWDWGINAGGKLGDNTVSTFPPSDPFGEGSNDRHRPIQVHGPGNNGYLNQVIAIMSGEIYTFALKGDGTVWAWGSNMFGVLGDGTTTDRYSPVQVSGLSGVIALGGRGYHSLAITADHSVWAWGWNASGELGDGQPIGTLVSSPVPIKVVGLSGVTAVTGGYQHSIALLSDKTLMAWGVNSKGQLGDGTNTNTSTPAAVKGLSDVRQVSAGWKQSLAVKYDGTVWAWGDNAFGELGDGTTTNRSLPQPVPGLTGMTAVSGGDCSSAALKSDGTVWTWGCNERGQLGDGTLVERHAPVQVVGLSGVTAIAARDYHNLALKADGTLWAWGWNINGQLGDGTTTTRPAPVQVNLLLNREYLPGILR